MIGRTLGHYRIVGKIGAGGMGEVYRAHDDQLDRDVALKVLPPGLLADEAARKRFRKEALALARLNHPNIETVYEFSTEDGVDFLALELIQGSPLSEMLRRGTLPSTDTIPIAIQLARALAAAHEQHVVHRDLKPGNLMITSDGRLKVLDFGLARLLRPARDLEMTVSVSEREGTFSGTVPYMSPEQLRGEPADARSDIFSAGIVLYEMATGRRPFPQDHAPTLMGAILHEAPAPPSSLNPLSPPVAPLPPPSAIAPWSRALPSWRLLRSSR
jgi:serine/threonine protein kinase